jgi:hypothetical protein
MKRTEYMRCPVKLTQSEINARAMSAARACSDRDRLEADDKAAEEAAKAAKGERKAQIEIAAREAARLAEIVRSGVEFRDVEVTWELYGDEMVAHRRDTGEIAERRPATEKDRQEVLAFDGSAERAELRAAALAAKRAQAKALAKQTPEEMMRRLIDAEERVAVALESGDKARIRAAESDLQEVVKAAEIVVGATPSTPSAPEGAEGNAADLIAGIAESAAAGDKIYQHGLEAPKKGRKRKAKTEADAHLEDFEKVPLEPKKARTPRPSPRRKGGAS